MKKEEKKIHKEEKKLHREEKHQHQSKSHQSHSKAAPHSGGSISNVVNGYAKALNDPWDIAAPSLGFGKFGVGIANTTSFVKGTFSTTGSDFMITGNPYDCCNSYSGSVTSSIMNGFLTVGQFANSVQAWNTSGQTNIVSSANCSVVSAIGKSLRVISAGLRVKVGQAVTSAAGLMGGARIPGITIPTSLDIFTNSTFLSLPAARTWMVKDGFAEVEINWSPQDIADFEFGPASTHTNVNGFYQPLIIYGSGLPTGTRVFYEFVVNVEMEQGVQASSGVISNFQAPSTSTISQTVASPDQLMSHAQGKVNTMPTFVSDPSREGYNSKNSSSFWDDISSAGSWAWDNRSSIESVVGMIGSLL